MKISVFLFFALLLTLAASGQKLQTDEVDEFTGSVVKRTEVVRFYSTFNEAAGLTVSRVDSSFYLSVSYNPFFGCVGAIDNYIIFLFEDGTNYNLDKDLSDLKCAGYGHSLYAINPDAFNGKKVNKVRIRMGDSTIDREWNNKGKVKYTLEQLIEATR